MAADVLGALVAMTKTMMCNFQHYAALRYPRESPRLFVRVPSRLSRLNAAHRMSSCIWNGGKEESLFNRLRHIRFVPFPKPKQ